MYVTPVENVLHESRHLPANVTFFPMIRILVHANEMFTDGAEINRHFSSTLKKLVNVFANL